LLQRIREEKYSGTEQKRFGPTWQRNISGRGWVKWARRRCDVGCLAEGLWSPACGGRKATAAEGAAGSTLADLVQAGWKFSRLVRRKSGPQGSDEYVDDARGPRVRAGESRKPGSGGVLRSWIRVLGARAWYTDWKNVYKGGPPVSRQRGERLRGREGAHDAIWANVASGWRWNIAAIFSHKRKGRVGSATTAYIKIRLVKKEELRRKRSRATKPRMSIWKRNNLGSTTSVLTRSRLLERELSTSGTRAAKLREVFG